MLNEIRGGERCWHRGEIVLSNVSSSIFKEERLIEAPNNRYHSQQTL